jgi:hypothetical protein
LSSGQFIATSAVGAEAYAADAEKSNEEQMKSSKQLGAIEDAQPAFGRMM